MAAQQAAMLCAWVYTLMGVSDMVSAFDTNHQEGNTDARNNW
jgi:hypothetical protein